MKKNRPTMLRIILFAIAAVLCDVCTTYTIVGVLGGVEYNPIIDKTIKIGWIYFILTKFAIGIGLPFIVRIFTKVNVKMLLAISAWLHLIVAIINSMSLVIYFVYL